MSGKDFSKLLPGARTVSVEELARQQGVSPVVSAVLDTGVASLIIKGVHRTTPVRRVDLSMSTPGVAAGVE